MKHLFILMAFMLLATVSLKATQITVSNDPSSPAQYHNLQTAINTVAPGDTILVGSSVLNIYGSPISYGNINIYNRVVLIGAGAFFENGGTTGTKKEVTLISSISLKQTTVSSGASGSKILGVYCPDIYFTGGFSGSTYATGRISDVLIENCRVSSIMFSCNNYQYSTFSNDTIRNCIIESHIDMDNRNDYNRHIKYKQISIENNIFNNAYINGSAKIAAGGNSLDSVYVRNNLFLNRTTYAFSTVPHLVIENNIFWKAEPNVANTTVGVTFNNNLCYLTTNTLPGTGNIGSGNINSTNPQFVNYPAQGGAFSCSHDYSIPTTSSAHNAGTDGSDIGLTGGISPFYDYCAGPKVPTIKEITMPANASSVPQGGTLNVTFKAKNKD